MPKQISSVTIKNCVVTMWSDCSLIVTLGDVDKVAGTFTFTPDTQMYFLLTNKTACSFYDFEKKTWNVEALHRWLRVQFQIELLHKMNWWVQG